MSRQRREILANTVLIAASGVAVLAAVTHHAHRIEREVAHMRQFQHRLVAGLGDDLAQRRRRDMS